jgi:hypothetical protein
MVRCKISMFGFGHGFFVKWMVQRRLVVAGKHRMGRRGVAKKKEGQGLRTDVQGILESEDCRDYI